MIKSLLGLFKSLKTYAVIAAIALLIYLSKNVSPGYRSALGDSNIGLFIGLGIAILAIVVFLLINLSPGIKYVGGSLALLFIVFFFLRPFIGGSHNGLRSGNDEIYKELKDRNKVLKDNLALVAKERESSSNEMKEKQDAAEIAKENDALTDSLCRSKEFVNTLIDSLNILDQKLSTGTGARNTCTVELKKRVYSANSASANSSTRSEKKNGEWMASAKTTETNGKPWMQNTNGKN